MNKIIFALSILGLEKTEHHVCNLLLDLVTNVQYGEVPGKNLRGLLELTKEKLFDALEKLQTLNVIKYVREPLPDSVYIKAGEGFYMFNSQYKTWRPTESSLFYKICKQLGHRFTEESYLYILDNYNIRDAVEAQKSNTEERLIPYQLYDIFCERYKTTFHREYRSTNTNRDLAYMKKVLFECSMKNLKDSQIREFLDWSFRVKTRDFKGEFLVGFLPLCLKDYLASTLVEKTNSKFIKDEDGRLKLK